GGHVQAMVRELVGEQVEERPLVHRLQGRMGIQHLLEQGGAGAREADDEYGRVLRLRGGQVWPALVILPRHAGDGSRQKWCAGFESRRHRLLQLLYLKGMRLGQRSQGGLDVTELVASLGEREIVREIVVV